MPYKNPEYPPIPEFADRYAQPHIGFHIMDTLSIWCALLFADMSFAAPRRQLHHTTVVLHPNIFPALSHRLHHRSTILSSSYIPENQDFLIYSESALSDIKSMQTEYDTLRCV